MGKVLIIDDDYDRDLIASLIAKLASEGVKVVCPTKATLITLRPHYSSELHTPPNNHPDGWYRKFEKRNKRK